MKWLLIGIAALSLAGCGGGQMPTKTTPDPPLPKPVFSVGSLNNVYTFHDDEHDVTCWLYVGYNQGGISCLPDSQLKEK